MAKAEIKKGKKNPSEKGVETMFRISSSNQQRLSNMADNKAHILITVNAIILSAVLSLLLRHLTASTYLTLPVFLQLVISLITMVFAILVTRPKISSGRFLMKDVSEEKVNLLFFGNFYKMNLTEYTNAMQELMQDSNLIYGNLIMDGYAEGVVLGRKYRLLRICYNIFMFGLIVSVTAFIVAAFLNGPLTNIFQEPITPIHLKK